MKRISFCLLGAFLTIALAACSVPSSDGGEGGTPDDGKQEETLMPYDKYDLDTYTSPVWNTKVIYNETLLFVGKDDVAPLMRTAVELVSVRSYDLKIEYEYGKDYTFSDNCIKLTDQTTVPYFEEEEYYPVFPTIGEYFDCTHPDHPFILFGEGDTFCSRQIAVTYKTREKWSGFVPESQTQYVAQFTRKLQSGEGAKVVFYGDSITTGANSSGFIGVEPYAESWDQMVVRYLNRKYGVEIVAANTAAGGKDSDWAIDNVSEAVTAYAPDLVVVAFGMNDINLTAEQYGQKIRTLTGKIKSENPSAEMVLVSPMLPNKEVGWVYRDQEQFEEQLVSIGAEEGYGVARVTSLHKQVLRNKRYRDMTGNNVNHPNDFLARLYAQTLLKALLGGEFDA